MDSASFDPDRYVPVHAHTVKVVVLGAFAVGKTTFVDAISDIAPLRTEEHMTHAGELVDHLDGLSAKTTTTVAMDFGRVALASDLMLYVFGAPGQPRFEAAVTTLMQGALGGLVLLDTRDIGAAFPWIDLLEGAGLHYAVAVNSFPDAPRYPEAELRDALTMPEKRPLVSIDARDRESAKHALIALVSTILATPEPVR